MCPLSVINAVSSSIIAAANIYYILKKKDSLKGHEKLFHFILFLAYSITISDILDGRVQGKWCEVLINVSLAAIFIKLFFKKYKNSGYKANTLETIG